MRYSGEINTPADHTEHGQQAPQVLHVSGSENTLPLPDESFVRDSNMTREGMDLALESPQGTLIIENYYAFDTPPDLIAPDGTALTPGLVESFAQSPAEYAQASTLSDASPVGAVQEFDGQSTITRTDGTIDAVSIGTPIYEGDIIETGANGAVNITFIDETSFAVSEDSRMAIDEYVYDPATESGVQDFSVLKGVFVFTSGLIGREDPDDVSIETPVGSIGIRGTIIAGDVNQGEITVVEGAIVLKDFSGNEITLANQFETGRFDTSGNGIQHIGQLSAQDVGTKFASVSKVSPQLFSSINDAANEQKTQGDSNAQKQQSTDTDTDTKNTPQEAQDQTGEHNQDAAPDNKANGTIDQNNDNKVDGTVEDAPEKAQEQLKTDGTKSNSLENTQQIQSETKSTIMETMMNTEFGDNNTMMQKLNSILEKATAIRQINANLRAAEESLKDMATDNVNTTEEKAETALQSDTTLFDPTTHSITDDTNTYTDTIQLTKSNQHIQTGVGNDTIWVGKNTTGNIIDGGIGTDLINFSNFTDDLEINLNTSASGEGIAKDSNGNEIAKIVNIENIHGGAGNDIITGNATSNDLRGDDGDDILNGEAGNDVLKGGDGNDILNGGAGDDILNGGAGHNKAYGGAGDDILIIDESDFDGDVYNALNDPNVKFDGGDNNASGYGDILKLITSGDSNIDLRAASNGALINGKTTGLIGEQNGIITNIETLLIDDNGHTPTITLDYTSVIDMTDGDNRLIIKADDSTTINFYTAGADTDSTLTQETIDGETYDVHVFNGDTTLLVNINTDINIY